jgi:hypothetical protein
MAELKRNELNRQNFLRFRGLVNATKSDFPVTEMESPVLFLIQPSIYLKIISNTEIQINWINSNQEITEIEISTDSGSTFTALITKSVGDTFHRVSGLVVDSTYVFRVRTRLVNLLSVYSLEHSVNIQNYGIGGLWKIGEDFDVQ